MTFEPQALDGSIEFTEDDKNTTKLVRGTGQWVYWKECSSISYAEGAEKKKHYTLTGQVKLQSGIAVYFVEGYVKVG